MAGNSKAPNLLMHYYSIPAGQKLVLPPNSARTLFKLGIAASSGNARVNIWVGPNAPADPTDWFEVARDGTAIELNDGVLGPVQIAPTGSAGEVVVLSSIEEDDAATIEAV